MDAIAIYSDEQETTISSEGIEAEEYTTRDSRIIFAAYYNTIVRRSHATRIGDSGFQKLIDRNAI